MRISADDTEQFLSLTMQKLQVWCVCVCVSENLYLQFWLLNANLSQVVVRGDKKAPISVGRLYRYRVPTRVMNF